MVSRFEVDPAVRGNVIMGLDPFHVKPEVDSGRAYVPEEDLVSVPRVEDPDAHIRRNPASDFHGEPTGCPLGDQSATGHGQEKHPYRGNAVHLRNQVEKAWMLHPRHHLPATSTTSTPTGPSGPGLPNELAGVPHPHPAA